jgi:hypothetical protein
LGRFLEENSKKKTALRSGYRLVVDIPIQNAPSRIAPTKAMAANTASTSSFKAMPTRFLPGR